MWCSFREALQPADAVFVTMFISKFEGTLGEIYRKSVGVKCPALTCRLCFQCADRAVQVTTNTASRTEDILELSGQPRHPADINLSPHLLYPLCLSPFPSSSCHSTLFSSSSLFCSLLVLLFTSPPPQCSASFPQEQKPQITSLFPLLRMEDLTPSLALFIFPPHLCFCHHHSR